MAASDYVPIFFKNRLHLAGPPQMGLKRTSAGCCSISANRPNKPADAYRFSSGEFPVLGFTPQLVGLELRLEGLCLLLQYRTSPFDADMSASNLYRKWSILHGGRLSAEATLFSRLWNHSPVVNFVSDRIFATGADGTWRLYPSVSHGTLDILPLEPSASWAGKRSQILAEVTRLNSREPHW